MAVRTMGEMKAHIAGRAMKDPDFRARLLADPRSVISAELDVRIPDTFTIHVHSMTAHLLLPQSDSLTEEELAKAAGGHPGHWGH